MAERDAKQDSVVIPTTFSPVCYTCVRSLAKSDINTIVVSESKRVPAGWSRFCDERIRLCSPYDDVTAYKDALLRVAARPDVRTILPLRPPDPYVLTTYREEFEKHISIPVPSAEALSIINDRMKLYEAAIDARVPVPDTWLFEEFDQWDKDVIIKSRYNYLTAEQVSSYTSSQSGTQKDIIHVAAGDEPNRDAIVSTMKHNPIVQEYVQNEDQYVFGALYHHGDPVATFQHRQIRGNSYTGGGGVYRESVHDPELETIGRTLLSKLDWHGIACVEYAKDITTGEYKLLEINPRFWQSLPCAVRAGADFPTYYWLQATNQVASIDSGYEIGVRSHYLYGEMKYLLSIYQDESSLVDRPSLPITAWQIMISCLMTPNFDLSRLDDPVPFLCGLRWVLKNNL